MRGSKLTSMFLFLIFTSLVCASPSRAVAQSQERAQPSQPGQSQPGNQSIGGELAKETREAAGEEEEHEDLKHSNLIKKFAAITGMSVHQAHMVATGINFAIIVIVIYWLSRKSVPAAMRRRNESIQRALEDARAASTDANRRLAEIEARLKKLDSEVAQMQSDAEREAAQAEIRIKAAAEDDIRKVVHAAEQEIEAAAKQARRELLSHTADLAVALARKQIQVDAATDQSLVRDFAVGLTRGNGGKGRS